MRAACLGELRAALPAFHSGREFIDADAQPNRSVGQGRLDCLTAMQERRAQLLELWQTALAPEVALQLSGTKQQNSGQVDGHARHASGLLSICGGLHMSCSWGKCSDKLGRNSWCVSSYPRPATLMPVSSCRVTHLMLLP